jgi:hypothetical protein
MNESFNLAALQEKWFHWDEVYACFWPEAGANTDNLNPELLKIRNSAGVYCIAWGDPSGSPNPASSNVIYIGQTKSFRRRLSEFATSSGIFYDDRFNGHSAAWRWPKGKYEKMHIAFFVVESNVPAHLLQGKLFWQEALAIHAFYLKHNEMTPPLNANNGEEVVLN